MRATAIIRLVPVIAILCATFGLPGPALAKTPDWLKQLTALPLPEHEDRTDAILLLADTVLSVKPNGDIIRVERRAFRILRPDGRGRAVVRVDYDTQSSVNRLAGWSIPADGKDYEVGIRDSVESAVLGVDGSELIDDSRSRVLRIPGALPGSVIGYEYEVRLRPYQLFDEWDFQETVPGVQAQYTLQLPPGWTYRASWGNHDAVEPTAAGDGQWRWTIRDIGATHVETNMPPWRAVSGRMFLSLVRPAPNATALESWHDIGSWYLELIKGRRDATPAIHAKVLELTQAAQTPLEKLQALARFVQQNIRYVAIELGIGGQQPHAAGETYAKRYGDCKDKVTLLSAMLKEVGIDSYYVVIHTQRGFVTPQTPPNLSFNHVILAIRLPGDVKDARLQVVQQHPRLGSLLFFDPTDDVVPLGQLAGGLQANTGLLVTPEGGELVTLPRLPVAASSIRRSAKFSLDELGGLQGDVEETRLGDFAAIQRYELRNTSHDADRTRAVEAVLAESFTNYKLVSPTASNLQEADLPFQWRYGLQVQHYAKATGDLLFVRPRVLGSKTQGYLETKDPRVQAIVFDEARRDVDEFVIDLPPGFEPESVPPPVRSDVGFAAYESKTEYKNHQLRYMRSFEIRELLVPVEKALQLRDLYRTIDNDERLVAVLKRTGT